VAAATSMSVGTHIPAGCFPESCMPLPSGCTGLSHLPGGISSATSRGVKYAHIVGVGGTYMYSVHAYC
jgi:hypothetical protein